jgi:hypothetical protein
MRRTGYPVFEMLILALPLLAILIWLVARAASALFRG